MAMSDEVNAPVRGTAVYILAAMCIVTALCQFFVILTLISEPGALTTLSMVDTATLVSMFLPVGLGICISLAAGVAVYRMRLEALACMGYLLTTRLAWMAQRPLQLVHVLDLLILLVTIYFTLRLFKPASMIRPTAAAGWKHPFMMLFVGLAAGHLAVICETWRVYFKLISMGIASPVLVVTMLLGCVALYTGVLTTRTKPRGAKKFFVSAAFAMGLLISIWGREYGIATPSWIGMSLALLGFWLARKLQPVYADSAAGHHLP